ncbi:hypothetical protein CAEBREN_16426 [Caenorhabditis brenneri]|uniref:Uncharacterized protein n=1 Tax=Caenorhabditis brenneri TaxID=135651 RepID=G0NJV0_CAEBE|nr:hypothetical protein CAEBREN_16426 [Caenorhabditis brenneri]
MKIDARWSFAFQKNNVSPDVKKKKISSYGIQLQDATGVEEKVAWKHVGNWSH